MSTNSLLTRCKQRAVRYSPRSTYSCLFYITTYFQPNGNGERRTCAPCYLDFYWGSPQPILTPNYTIPHIASVNPTKHLSKSVAFGKTCPSLLVLSEISIQQRGCAVIDCGTAPFLMGRFCFRLVNQFVGFVATHFADGVLQHDVLLEEVVDGHFVLRVVVHRALEVETQEALDAVAAIAAG